MKNLVSSIALAVAIVFSGSADSAIGKEYSVRYLSAENVYLNGGSVDGLSVGDRLALSRANGCRSEVEVVFVAEHSASCTLVVDSCTIALGDRLMLITSVAADTTTPAVDTSATESDTDSVEVQPFRPKPVARPTPPRVVGSVALLFYYWNDNGPSNLDFTQSTARLNVKARRLFSREITFNLRARGRYDQRQRAYSSAVSREAWENRIWEMSLSYDEPASAYSLAAGRILPRRLSSAGYLDGLLIERRVGKKTRVGLLAGTQPQWAYDHGAVSLQKGGAYLSYISGEPGGTQLEQIIAGIGEYHAGVVSRELVSLQGRFNKANQFVVSHTVEFDINRRWRRDRAGEAITLSSAYIGAWYRVIPRIRATLSYDNRVNYWTYETKSTVDSLFDDRLRQGIRAQIDATLPGHLQSSFGYGLRKREGDGDPTISYSVNLMKSGLWRHSAMGSIQYASFNGQLESGYNYSGRLSDYVTTKVYLSVGYGSYSYKADLDLNHRTSNWYEVTGQADLSRKYFIALSAQINSGDDIDGVRLQSELGWRF